ncbi:MAG: hypothetical protein WDZ53_08235 [Balneolales bacterium]
MKRFGLILCSLGFFGISAAQERPSVNIPDILGYKTLTSDLHTHTVFSDGQVWPPIRVEEAWQEGIDIISLTDHVESTNLYRLKSIFGENIDREGGFYPDRNRSYEVAKPSAENRDILLLKGVEISRTMPPGHHNAVFINDVNKINTPHPQWKEAFTEARKQGAFIFWNHPATFPAPERTTIWWEEHTWLLENDMMHGIEVVNGRRYDPVAHQWAIDKKLAIIANTDIHGPIGMSYDIHNGERRPMTLVFAKERSMEGIKEAYFDRRTVAYYDNKLVGDPKFLDPIFFNSIQVESVRRTGQGFQVIINNPTEIPFELSKAAGNDPALEFLVQRPCRQAGRQRLISIPATLRPLIMLT